MPDRLKFRRVRKGLWRHRTYTAEKQGSKWIVRKGHRLVCDSAKNLTAASSCIIEDNGQKR
jgi:hypothetical protein